jgi:salicylate hydroxylase
MSDRDAISRHVLIAGGGIAGLTAAIAFAERGFSVRLFERAAKLQEHGAGLQLSPNATGILDRLGVLARLKGAAMQPENVILRDARSLAAIARVPLGEAGTARWGAPYLVLHRADLHAALLSIASRDDNIEITTGATVRDAVTHGQGVTVSIDTGGRVKEASGRLFVVADGVWSANRALVGSAPESAFTGRVAWRATLRTEAQALSSLISAGSVNAFLHPRAHLIAYPIRGGASVNLAAFAHGPDRDSTWAEKADVEALANAFAGADDALLRLLREAGPWTVWPIHTVAPTSPWINPAGIVAVGDAAHAMTPFAAQGAAMAIEDAYVLAANVAAQPAAISVALKRYELARRDRVLAVARRGRLNEFAWHAGFPVSTARNLFLRLRGPDRLAADMDWLYGWKPPEAD